MESMSVDSDDDVDNVSSADEHDEENLSSSSKEFLSCQTVSSGNILLS